MTFDPVNRKVKLLVGQMIVNAHGLPGHIMHPGELCAHCEGDGCLWCHFTGEKPAGSSGGEKP